MIRLFDFSLIRRRSAALDADLRREDLDELISFPGTDERLGPLVASIQIRILMQCLPMIPSHLSFNGRRRVVERYLVELGCSHGEHFDDSLVRSILDLVSSIEGALRGAKKQSWSDLHYSTQNEFLTRQNFRCVVCGIPFSLGGERDSSRPELDHIIPFAIGGNRPSNLRIICGRCNRAKREHIGVVNSASVMMNYFLRHKDDSSMPRAAVRFWVFERDRSRCTSPGCENSSLTSHLTVRKRLEAGRAVAGAGEVKGAY